MRGRPDIRAHRAISLSVLLIAVEGEAASAKHGKLLDRASPSQLDDVALSHPSSEVGTVAAFAGCTFSRVTCDPTLDRISGVCFQAEVERVVTRTGAGSEWRAHGHLTEEAREARCPKPRARVDGRWFRTTDRTAAPAGRRGGTISAAPPEPGALGTLTTVAPLCREGAVFPAGTDLESTWSRGMRPRPHGRDLRWLTNPDGERRCPR